MGVQVYEWGYIKSRSAIKSLNKQTKQPNLINSNNQVNSIAWCEKRASSKLQDRIKLGISDKDSYITRDTNKTNAEKLTKLKY